MSEVPEEEYGLKRIKKYGVITLCLIGMMVSLTGCGRKRVNLRNVPGDTKEEQAENYLYEKYGEEYVVTDVSASHGYIDTVYMGYAYKKDDPTKTKFPVYVTGGGNDARFLLDYKEGIREDINDRVGQYLEDYYAFECMLISRDYLSKVSFPSGKSVGDLYALDGLYLDIYLCVPEDADTDEIESYAEQIAKDINCTQLIFRIYTLDDEILGKLQAGELDFYVQGMYAVGTLDEVYDAQQTINDTICLTYFGGE